MWNRRKIYQAQKGRKKQSYTNVMNRALRNDIGLCLFEGRWSIYLRADKCDGISA
jgi:hypothetical protein